MLVLLLAVTPLPQSPCTSFKCLTKSLPLLPPPSRHPAQSKAQGKVQLQFSRSLSDLVELPFAKWTDEHDARIVDSRRAVLDGWVGAWEKQREDVRKLKVLRGEKARSAELAEAE